MLLLKPPVQNGFSSPPHAYSTPTLHPSTSKTFAPPVPAGGSLPPLPDNQPRRMSTPHRGLPPPLAMTLPNPERQPPPPLAQPMGNLPAPPNQWQGADESMRNWLVAKAEEDKRKQEEERTRQEGVRLEQRRIEQNMLRESLQGGIPPHMVPIIFAGMAGGNLANLSLEWAQHYMAQISLQQQQAQQQSQMQTLPQPQSSSPDVRRDRSTTGPQPNPYTTQQPPALPVAHSQSSASGAFQSGYQIPGLANDRLRQGPQAIQAAPPTSVPRAPGQQAGLSRLNTGEMQIQPPPQGVMQLAGHHPLQQSQTAQQQQQQQEQQSTSPSIYFHHWVPPNSQKDPPASATKSQHSSPYSQNPASHLRSEYANSPKKRKTNASHNAASAKSPETSPQIAQPVSAGRRRAHSNQRSDASSRGTHEALGLSGSRPESRHRQQSTSEAESGSQRQGSIQPETTQSRDSAGPDRKRAGSGTPKREAEGPP